jgi:hypothetical protein
VAYIISKGYSSRTLNIYVSVLSTNLSTKLNKMYGHEPMLQKYSLLILFRIIDIVQPHIQVSISPPSNLMYFKGERSTHSSLTEEYVQNKILYSLLGSLLIYLSSYEWDNIVELYEGSISIKSRGLVTS